VIHCEDCPARLLQLLHCQCRDRFRYDDFHLGIRPLIRPYHLTKH
jgi:hypothetical protein